MTVIERPPPHITDPPQEVNTAENLPEEGVEVESPEDSSTWMRRAREAYYFSTTFVDSNYRKPWEDSIRAFNNQHSQDSKYNAASYDKRSKIYRPKTRSIIRKNEAAAASAFFSNMDVVSIEAQNQSNLQQRVSAEVMKQLMTYRLTKSVPWFRVVLGGLQDAQTQGPVCAHVYWDYDDTAEPKVDKPCVDLIPVENIRIDPAASWADPIGTSPYVIHLIPMYVGEVRRRMEVPDKQGKKWHEYGDGVIRQATQKSGDSTRITRNKNQEDPYEPDGRPVSDYEVVWVQRHIHRKDGKDWHFYTLMDVAMLSDPEPLKKVVFHGMRPFVMGCCVLETHKSMPSSVPMLMDGLQKEANELANQRLDNLKFVLNKAYKVRRGRNVDLGALVRNAPGRIIMADDPEKDIIEENWPDVTASSYEEQGRIDNDVNELVGNFSPMNLPNRKGSETVRGMSMLAQPANSLTEYLLRTYVETFIEPVLQHLVKLEQYYETDEVVLSLAAEKAKLFQRYGVSRVTDDMLNQDLTIKVNVGMGATDPMTKLQKIIQGVGAYVNIAKVAKMAAPELNLGEVGKELFGHMGYQDGARFFKTDDPEKARLQGQVQQMMAMLQQQGKMLKDKHESNVVKLESTKIKARTDLIKQAQEHQHQNRQMLAEVMIDQAMPPEEPPKAQNGS